MLYYPYKTMFSAYKTVIGSPCACDLFVSKVTKITRYMDVRFWRSFFSAFSVCDDCLLKSTEAWLLKLSVLYIHSFMQVHNTTFQIKTVFNNVLFSTEVHNPLHAHLLALSHIYIYIYMYTYLNSSLHLQLFLISSWFPLQMTRDLTAAERTAFQSVIRAAILDIVPLRYRDDFLANYNCCPPPVFILFISIAEVSVLISPEVKYPPYEHNRDRGSVFCALR